VNRRGVMKPNMDVKCVCNASSSAMMTLMDAEIEKKNPEKW